MTVVWLDVHAKALIEAETLKRPRTETGGALFGYDDGDDVVVACAYGPGPRAKHRRTTFEPHPATTAALMDAVRAASEARYRYLGSWHSHPNGAARPSGQDIATTERVANEEEVLLPRPLVLIQSTRGGPQGAELADVRAWRWHPQHAWLLPCALESVELDERYCPRVEVPGGRLRTAKELSPESQ
jgi:integrative and conjugative element protein (TIGR02256 family)